MAVMIDTGRRRRMRMPGGRGRRPKGCKLANNRWLRRTVARKLEIGLVARADNRLVEESVS